ncbi:hypothetical protein ACF0H5_021249 [Mactra antiquata]
MQYFEFADQNKKMARPKERINSVFQQKCFAETEKLRAFQGSSLTSDLERLFGDEILPDLDIIVNHQHILLHKCLLAARCPSLLEYIESLPKTADGFIELHIDTSVSISDLKHWFKLLYTKENPSYPLLKLEHCLLLQNSDELIPTQNSTLPSAQHSTSNGEYPVHDPDIGDVNNRDLDIGLRDSPNYDNDQFTRETINVISENITNTSLDLVKRDSRYIQQQLDTRSEPSAAVDRSNVDLEQVSIHSNHVSNCASDSKNADDNSQLYLLAEKIVDQVIIEAKAVIFQECSGSNKNESMRIKNTSELSSVNGVIKQNVNICNGYVAMATCNDGINRSTEIDNQGPSSTETETNASNCDFVKISNAGTKDFDGKSRFFTSKKKSSKSLQSLAEEVYDVKTVIRPCGQVGEDLLRILLTQQNCDFTIKVENQEFLTHRCILSCRSTYFEAMLSGPWRESDDNCITLEGFSPSVIKQTLLYLYGGVIDIEPYCSLGGLVTMADMYGMEGLKEIIALHLNIEYCHFFHRPCPNCISGVPEALALTLMYNMDSMKEKCFKWISKNFGKVWPTKTFMSLPVEVLELSVSGAINDLSIFSVLDTLVECQRLNVKTPHLKWTEPLFDMITLLSDAAIEFASKNFIGLISGKTFRKIDKEGLAFNQEPLEEIFGMIIQALSPERSIEAYLSFHKWKKTVEIREQEEISDYSKEFTDFVKVLFKKCKEQLCMYIHQAAYTTEWDLLSKDMQDDIMKDANYVCLDSNKARMIKPKLSSMQPKKVSSTSPLSLKEYFECHFGYPRQPESSVSKTKMDAKPRTTKTGSTKTAASVKEKTKNKETVRKSQSSTAPETGKNQKNIFAGAVSKVTSIPEKQTSSARNNRKTVQGMSSTINSGVSSKLHSVQKVSLPSSKSRSVRNKIGGSFQTYEQKLSQTSSKSKKVQEMVGACANTHTEQRRIRSDTYTCSNGNDNIEIAEGVNASDNDKVDDVFFDDFRARVNVADIELVELPVGIKFPPDILMPIIDVHFCKA